MNLSIIIPCYNEAMRINRTLSHLKGFKANYPATEIILVDDGSEDNIAQNIQKKDDDFILDQSYVVDQFITYKPNQGKGYAIRQGIEKASYKTILLLDADLSVHPQLEFQHSIETLNRYTSCMIQGERVQVDKQPPMRILAGKVFKALVFLKIGIFRDTQCPYKILHNIPPEVLKYKTDGFAFDVELIKRVKDAQIPIIYQRVAYYNQTGSKVTLMKTVKMLFELLKI